MSDVCRLLNLYGCTEAAGDSTCFVVPKAQFSQPVRPAMAVDDSMPIGSPIDGTCIVLMTVSDIDLEDGMIDTNGLPDNRVTVGEICIAGEGLCHGIQSPVKDDTSTESSFFWMSSTELQRNWQEGRVIPSDDWQFNDKDTKFVHTGDLGCLSPSGLPHQLRILEGTEVPVCRKSVVLWPSRYVCQDRWEVHQSPRH